MTADRKKNCQNDGWYILTLRCIFGRFLNFITFGRLQILKTEHQSCWQCKIPPEQCVCVPTDLMLLMLLWRDSEGGLFFLSSLSLSAVAPLCVQYNCNFLLTHFYRFYSPQVVFKCMSDMWWLKQNDTCWAVVETFIKCVRAGWNKRDKRS